MSSTGFYPEMGDKRPLDTQIDARLGHYGDHYYLTTDLELKGQGIKLLEDRTTEQENVGKYRYIVTIRAYEKLEKLYRISCEQLL